MGTDNAMGQHDRPRRHTRGSCKPDSRRNDGLLLAGRRGWGRQALSGSRQRLLRNNDKTLQTMPSRDPPALANWNPSGERNCIFAWTHPFHLLARRAGRTGRTGQAGRTGRTARVRRAEYEHTAACSYACTRPVAALLLPLYEAMVPFPRSSCSAHTRRVLYKDPYGSSLSHGTGTGTGRGNSHRHRHKTRGPAQAQAQAQPQDRAQTRAQTRERERARARAQTRTQSGAQTCCYYLPAHLLPVHGQTDRQGSLTDGRLATIAAQRTASCASGPFFVSCPAMAGPRKITNSPSGLSRHVVYWFCPAAPR